MAMMFISNWLNQFGRVKHFPIHGEFLTGKDVFIGQTSKISASLQQGGAVVVRLMYGCWHYALLTGADETSIYLFDPYYRKRPFTMDGLDLITDAPTKMNRRVANDIINSESKTAYALGPIYAREAVILFNKNTQKTPEKTIEYFI